MTQKPSALVITTTFAPSQPSAECRGARGKQHHGTGMAAPPVRQIGQERVGSGSAATHGSFPGASECFLTAVGADGRSHAARPLTEPDIRCAAPLTLYFGAPSLGAEGETVTSTTRAASANQIRLLAIALVDSTLKGTSTPQVRPR